MLTLSPAASASAAVQVGQTFVPDTAASGLASTFLQGGSPGGQYTVPSPGVITSWSFQAGSAPPAQLKLKVASATGGGFGEFRIVGASAPEAPVSSQLGVFATRIPVLPGDVLGIFSSGGFNTMVSLPMGSGYDLYRRDGDQAVGTTDSYSLSINPTYQLDVAAILEPDSDNDRFGDETQDGCPADPAIQGSCPDASPPDTTITRGPKDKTKKKQATFEFSSSEPGSTFECKLEDDIGFGSCLSPATVKVGKGKHNLQVRAKDAAGNVDPTPATDDWKVTKKKK